MTHLLIQIALAILNPLVVMSLTLALLYPLAIQYQRGGLWRVLMPLTLATAILDVIVNYSAFSLLVMEWPPAGERTVSQRCSRLIHQSGYRGFVARCIQAYCNTFMANHIS